MRTRTSTGNKRSLHALFAVLTTTAAMLLTIASLCCGVTSAAAISSIRFKNQCAHAINIFEGDERFCDLRAGSAETPAFGCATHLPLGLAIYSHTVTRNATIKCCMAHLLLDIV